MTDKEKAIVMAHTGICMLTGDKFQIFHKYVEDIMGRPIMTHEIGRFADAIKEKSKADFIALCADEQHYEAKQMTIETLEQESKAEQFAKWVATEIFDDMWEYNKDAFAEIACRKLAKLGIVRAKGDEWELIKPQTESEDIL